MKAYIKLLIISIIGGALFSILSYGYLSFPYAFGSALAINIVGLIITSMVLGFKVIFSGFDKNKYDYSESCTYG